MKKVLITGASGLLGRAIKREFDNDATWKVLGLAYSRAGGDLRRVDLSDVNAVKEVVREFQPDVIVHAAAERRPDIVDKKTDVARQLNVDVSRNLALIAKTFNCFILYVSTDYVFDGCNPPYQPADQPAPLNTYGMLKWQGEKAVLETYPKRSGILRLPILYGEVEYLEESAVTVLLKAIQNGNKPGEMSDYEKRYPTYVGDVAVVIRQISDKTLQDENFYGIWHWSGLEELTKYQMALKIAKAFNIDYKHLVAVNKPSPGAKRPYNSHLDISTLTQLNFGQQTSFQDGIMISLSKFIS
ncbi:uncharacterized protein TRIADDRAFT_25402 [Trichoplax adhaerens]|uniref:Methionine adenosyltransferase 2 subunit beta n=1 Tax=Trichoplax adhaerens TaxID=10228 RepID=B3RYK5_TRIAD|nr:hypothetical protein TRIADDRAFT_25402 [Trichoplax adhaerens]EDV24612.1 hypothetical protein TRIADDRAFT_25402 [Trichoplax adhaerens]|eukprot:XP_002112502.1 hypothetical protein TRIADDRAFT_25402 [Trichoplax adhaerens]